MTRFQRVVAFGLVFILFASPAHAAGKLYSRLSLNANSRDGALVFHAAPQPLNWSMILTPVDAEGRTRGFGKSLNMGGASVVPGGSLPLQIWMMKPGRYVIRFLKTQDHWAGCLAQSTFAIEIAAGKVAYIGNVDPAPTLRAVDREVARTGKTVSRGGIRMFHNGIAPPAVIGPEPRDQARIEAEIRSAAPGIVAPIFLSRPVPATFARKPKTNPLAACG